MKNSVLLEVKWRELSYSEAKKIILKLIERSCLTPEIRVKIRINSKEIVKKKLIDEGYIVRDLNDIVTPNLPNTRELT